MVRIAIGSGWVAVVVIRVIIGIIGWGGATMLIARRCGGAGVGVEVLGVGVLIRVHDGGGDHLVLLTVVVQLGIVIVMMVALPFRLLWVGMAAAIGMGTSVAGGRLEMRW